jgi:hypothetical protein
MPSPPPVPHLLTADHAAIWIGAHHNPAAVTVELDHSQIVEVAVRSQSDPTLST